MAAPIEIQIQGIRDSVLEMISLVQKQIKRSKEAVITFNKDKANDVIASEKSVNTFDLLIDNDCEKTLALFSPVADDLRFIVSVLKVNTYLERMGDNTEAIAGFINDLESPLSNEIIEKLELTKLFDLCSNMLTLTYEAFEEEETSIAAKVMHSDKEVDKINQNASSIIAELIKTDLDNTLVYINLLSIIRKMERIGDYTKNIAEEIVFFVDAKVLKHNTKKTKKFISKEMDQ